MSAYDPPLNNLAVYCDTMFPAQEETGNFVLLTGNQTIAGIKTFNDPPVCSITASSATQLVNKSYVDNLGAGYVDLTTTQTIGGNKSFTNSISCGGLRTSGDVNQSSGNFVNSNASTGQNGSGSFKNFTGMIWRMTGSSAGSGTGGGYSPLLYNGDIVGAGTGFGCDVEGNSFPSYNNGGVNVPAEGRDQWVNASGFWSCRVKGNYLIQPSIFIRDTDGAVRLYLTLNRASGTYSKYIIKADGDVITSETQVSYSNTLSIDVGDRLLIEVYSTTGSYIRPYFEASSLATTNLTHYTTLTINRIVG